MIIQACWTLKTFVKSFLWKLSSFGLAHCHEAQGSAGTTELFVQKFFGLRTTRCLSPTARQQSQVSSRWNRIDCQLEIRISIALPQQWKRHSSAEHWHAEHVLVCHQESCVCLDWSFSSERLLLSLKHFILLVWKWCKRMVVCLWKWILRRCTRSLWKRMTNLQSNFRDLLSS